MKTSVTFKIYKFKPESRYFCEAFRRDDHSFNYNRMIKALQEIAKANNIEGSVLIAEATKPLENHQASLKARFMRLVDENGTVWLLPFDLVEKKKESQQ